MVSGDKQEQRIEEKREGCVRATGVSSNIAHHKMSADTRSGKTSKNLLPLMT